LQNFHILTPLVCGHENFALLIQSDIFFIKSISIAYLKIWNYSLWYPIQIWNRSLSYTFKAEMSMDQDWSQFWLGQDWIRLQFFEKLTDQDWIGLKNFCCIYVIILNTSKILVMIRFYRFAEWECRLFCHEWQWQKLCWDNFAVRTVSTFVHI